ncbi:hypothetical protein [Mesorhizobium sp.]|uniref:hypothetical protein n=1 Tax=Mesorhizobium sp. TaxID=1871066 RepID=UPI00257E0BE8|nr:hypothetical protein [Mesorhizobium sp.]
MAANNNIMLWRRPELARHDLGPGAVGFVDEPEFLRHLVVEDAMNPPDEIDRSRARQLPTQTEAVNHPLNFDMRLGLQGERSAFRVNLGSGQCTLDVPRSGFVTFDQIRIVRIHDAHEIGQFGSRFRMQGSSEFIGRLLRLDREIGQDGRYRVVKKQRLNAGRCFKHSCRSQSSLNHLQCKAFEAISQHNCRYRLPISGRRSSREPEMSQVGGRAGRDWLLEIISCRAAPDGRAIADEPLARAS